MSFVTILIVKFFHNLLCNILIYQGMSNFELSTLKIYLKKILSQVFLLLFFLGTRVTCHQKYFVLIFILLLWIVYSKFFKSNFCCNFFSFKYFLLAQYTCFFLLNFLHMFFFSVTIILVLFLFVKNFNTFFHNFCFCLNYLLNLQSLLSLL